MLQFIRLRPGGDFWVGAGFFVCGVLGGVLLCGVEWRGVEWRGEEWRGE